MGPEDSQLYVTLKDHLNARIDHLEDKLKDSAKLNQAAVDKAEQQMNRLLEGMNEFRDALKDQATRLIPREEADSRMRNLEARIKELELSHASSRDLNVRFDIVNERIKQLEDSRAELRGKASAQALTATQILAAISLIIALLGLVAKFL